ncbi:hypothetical protein Tco_1452787 [Tanacetum coccineum]
MSPIPPFSYEDMYEPQHSDSYQNTAREDSPVEVTAPAQPKLVKRRQRRTARNEDTPRCLPWTNEKEIVLCKGWVHVSKNSNTCNAGRDSGFWNEVVAYVESKNKGNLSRTYDMVNGKWKTVRPNVARFCGVYANVMRRGRRVEPESKITSKRHFLTMKLNTEYRLHFVLVGRF